jgi:hypothetical protein
MRPILIALLAPVIFLGGCASLAARDHATAKSPSMMCPMMGGKSMPPGAMPGGKEMDSVAMKDCMKKMQSAGAPPAAGTDAHDHKDKP